MKLWRILCAAIVALTPLAASAAPNIVLILSDDEPIDGQEHMPYIQSRSDWIVFDHAYVATPLCCPSRAEIFTGEYDLHNGVTNNGQGKLLDETSTVATWLASAHYTNGMFGKYLNLYPFGRAPYVPPGWKEWHAFNVNPRYYDYSLVENNAVVVPYPGTDPANYATDVLAAKAANFIATAKEPFFVYYAPFSPHLPTTVAQRHLRDLKGTPVFHSPNFNEADVSDKPAWVRALPLMNPTQVKARDNSRRAFWRANLAVDDAVGELFAALDARGVTDRTVVIYLTDNGYVFGEHRWREKRCVYEGCLATPLRIRFPNQPGRVQHQLVSNIDLASTIAGIAGASPTRPQNGISLLPLLKGRTREWRRSALFFHFNGSSDSPTGHVTPGDLPGYYAIRTDNWKYAELFTGERELYDEANDPWELQNQADMPAFAKQQASLKAQLD